MRIEVKNNVINKEVLVRNKKYFEYPHSAGDDQNKKWQYQFSMYLCVKMRKNNFNNWIHLLIMGN